MIQDLQPAGRPHADRGRAWGVIAAAVIVALVSALFSVFRSPAPPSGELSVEELVVPREGVVLAATWGDLGRQMVEAGVIDAGRFEAVYQSRGGLDAYGRALLTGEGNGRLRIDRQNAGVILNLLWALGLANQNPVLEEGPMRDPRYGGPGGFASTGGWTLARGSAMEHYSSHSLVALSPAQQELVEATAKNIYRPCCNNHTYFPDCNHGMAMLGLLELLAAQGAGEAQIYEVALQVNSYWFPQNYLTVADYYAQSGMDWSEVDPQEALGPDSSSSAGYSRILAEVGAHQGGGGSCGV